MPRTSSQSRSRSTSRSSGRRAASSSSPRTKGGKQAKVHKVMEEYKEGALKSGPGGKGGKVASRKQAIAIAMHESGQSRRRSPSSSAHA